jgi:hypothetical protein
VSTTGWISYSSLSSLTLSDRAGIHAIQVAVADQAGNISSPLVSRTVNLVLPQDALRQDQVRLYRRTLAAGETVGARLETLSGDADLYIWGPSGHAVLASNATGATIDEGTIVAATVGTYQIEVFAAADSTYKLTFPDGTGATPPPGKPARTAPVVGAEVSPVQRTALPLAPARISPGSAASASPSQAAELMDEIGLLSPLVTVAAIADVLAVTTAWNADRTLIETSVRLHLAEILAGTAPAEITITQPGGELDGVGLAVSEMPTWQAGERALLLLAERDGHYHVVGLGTGKLQLPELNVSVADVVEVVRTGQISPRVQAAVDAAPPTPRGSGVGAAATYIGYFWATSSFPIPFQVNPANRPPAIDEATMREQSLKAFTNWTAASRGAISWRAAGTTTKTGANDGTNVLYWGPINRPGVLGVTSCWYATDTRIATDCDVIFEQDPTIADVRYPWSASQSPVPRTISFEAVALHEFGHFMGISHSTDPSAIMYPSIVLGGKQPGVDADDIVGAVTLYGAAIPTPFARVHLPLLVRSQQNGW